MNHKLADQPTTLSRRAILRQSAFCTAGAAALLIPAAQANAAKMQKTAAQYQETPKGDQRCDNCGLFQQPNACQVVDGDISPSAWCKLWVKKAS